AFPPRRSSDPVPTSFLVLLTPFAARRPGSGRWLRNPLFRAVSRSRLTGCSPFAATRLPASEAGRAACKLFVRTPYMRMTKSVPAAAVASALLVLSGCGGSSGPQLAPASFVAMQEGPGEEYVIGPLDKLTIHVWRNDELGAQVQVRPDGRITTPLVADMPAVGKTPTMLAEDIRL